jgi:hypothetical protein
VETANFWRHISPLSSGFKTKLSKKLAEVGGKLSLPSTLLVSCLAYSSTLNTEAIQSSKLFGGFQTTWHYSPQENHKKIFWTQSILGNKIIKYSDNYKYSEIKTND